ncbi:MAG TPA: DddA-like double-stranded DNA deaminase toxin [Pseudonocardiaceae bacterium]|nr:DddA-like double-stranded DNA deaminase toxin [Pseudonocardiaceae bacterium]
MVVVLGICFVISHYERGTAKFGCVASAAAAHADSGECPTNATAAATDSRWAASRLAGISASKITTGLFYDEDGTEHTYVSGYDADADAVTNTLHAIGAPFPRSGPHPVAAHVEAKAAARMRDNGLAVGLLVINNPRGVCTFDSGYSCQEVVPLLLPAGARLFVWFPGAKQAAEFVGKV